MKTKTEEVEINEDVTPNKEESSKTETVWPEYYESYLGDGIYLGYED
jgi:hypothetical protein